MRTLDEALNQFAYHPATPETAPKHAAVRDLFRDLLPKLWDAVPDGPEKTLAIRALQESQMYANLAIALTAPADTSASRATPRVLPDKPVPPAQPPLQGTQCGCKARVPLSPGEVEYREGGVVHRRPPAECS